MQAAKRRVTYLQAMWPCALILIVTLLVLIIWTAVDPWKWERDYIDLLPPERLGKCTSDHFAGFFWTLTSILMFCTVSTLVMAWKTQTIAQNLSDASTVFYLILTQVQAWFVGIPILAVTGDSVDTVYFGRILLIWLFAMAPLFIVLLPRVSQAIRQKLNPALKQTRGNVHVSGIAASTSQYPTTNRPFESTNSSATGHLNASTFEGPSKAFRSSVFSPLKNLNPRQSVNKPKEEVSTQFRTSVTASSALKMPDVDEDEEHVRPARPENPGGLPTIVSQHVLQMASRDKESFPSFAE